MLRRVRLPPEGFSTRCAGFVKLGNVSVSQVIVSAVIPVLNGEAYVAEAIKSVLAQTFQSLECIVVDNGSTDGTVDVLGAFSGRVTFLRQVGGVAAARNAGARAARGRFLAFLDADDMWEPAKVERQMALFETRPELGLVYCGIRTVDNDGRCLSSVPAPDPSVALRNTLLDESPYVCLAQTGIVPRDLFLSVGGFDERLAKTEDSDLIWRLAVRFPVAAVPEPLARYRRHLGQSHERNLLQREREWKSLLDSAFHSALLPAEVQRIERRARTNMSLTLAYLYRRKLSYRAVVHMCQAFRFSPLHSLRWLAEAAGRRCRRVLRGVALPRRPRRPG